MCQRWGDWLRLISSVLCDMFLSVLGDFGIVQWIWTEEGVYIASWLKLGICIFIAECSKQSDTGFEELLFLDFEELIF